jgi:UDP-N-acetylglucosamine--N-acetylmuramyl-(pentapeptide) pyrophosphoryl-undecaprenol N-acetylglucosamine transferase
MLHESNALPGMAVRRLQNDVDIIMTNFESTKELLSSDAKVINVGNPLRSACNTLTREQARKKLGIGDDVKFVVLSFGGSMGAERVNRAAAEMMGNFASKYKDIKCFHIGGKKNFESAKSCFSAYGLERDPRFVLMEYTSELPTYMAAADAVICRAGAMTLTEIAKMGKPSVIIPSPNVVDDHQYKNAKALADADAAVVICEDELNLDGKCMVCEAMQRFYEDSVLRERMSENIKKFAKPDVEKSIYEAICGLLDSYKKIIPKGE